MRVQPIFTHVSDAEGRLLEESRGQPRIAALLAMVTNGYQFIEQTAFALSNGRSLDGAGGAQLDRLGELLGFPRSGLEDEVYRAVLRGVVAENFSEGTYAAARDIAASLYGAAAVFITSYPDAKLAFGIGSPTVGPELYPVLQGVFFRALSAGVEVVSIETFNAEGAFSMDGPAPWVQGFGSASEEDDLTTGGGGFGDAIYQNT